MGKEGLLDMMVQQFLMIMLLSRNLARIPSLDDQEVEGKVTEHLGDLNQTPKRCHLRGKYTEHSVRFMFYFLSELNLFCNTGRFTVT